MDRIKLLTESMKWWASKIVDAADADEVEFILDQVRHAKYEISNKVREAEAAVEVGVARDGSRKGSERLSA